MSIRRLMWNWLNSVVVGKLLCGGVDVIEWYCKATGL